MQRSDIKINQRLISPQHDMSHSQFSYYPAGTVKQHSFIMRSGKDILETYQPKRELGRGANGVVRLFHSKEERPDQPLAVKSPLGIESQGEVGDEEYQEYIDALVRATNREVMYFSRLYPELSPCLVEHFINDDNQYDNRMLMPYLPGKTLSYFVKTEIHSAPAYALMMLKISQEVARLHEMGLYHGDLRSGNIMIQQSDKMEFGMPSYTVHLIDFDHGGEIGKDRFADVEGDIAFFEICYMGVNHQTDIMYLQLWFNFCKVNFLFRYPDEKGRLLENFPAFTQFSAQGDDVEMPVPEPEKLKKFIADLTENLSAWQLTNRFNGDHKQRYTANLGLFPMRKTSRVDEERIAEQWEANHVVL
jgi:serine/threonine protein kinase